MKKSRRPYIVLLGWDVIRTADNHEPWGMKSFLYVGHINSAYCYRPGIPGYLLSRYYLAVYELKNAYFRCLGYLWRTGWLKTELGCVMSIKDLRWKWGKKND